jgi:glycosyltransferase involved in cell wall biosynthesis
MTSSERPVPAPAPARLESLSAFFPVHDEEANVVPMAEGVLGVLREVAERWELIIVDDGSRDATGRLADQLARQHADARVVHHPVNRGYGAAIRTGLAAARHQYVFLVDGDRQFDPGQIRLLIPALAEADVVVGYRVRRADDLGRRLAGTAWNWTVRLLLGLRVRDVNCGFKLFHRRALDGLELTADGACISAELLANVRRRGQRIVEVPVNHLPRPAGRASGAAPRVVARAGPELLRIRRRLGAVAPAATAPSR